MNPQTIEREAPAMVAEQGMVGMLNRSEIERQIATARRFPRSIKRFRDEALAMVTITPSPTPDQREVLRQYDAIFAPHGIAPELRQQASARYLASISHGRSTAVAVCEMRRVAHQRPSTTTSSGPSAA